MMVTDKEYEMDLSVFETLPDDARLWIHGFENELEEHERAIIDQELGRFLPQWASHGTSVQAVFTVLFSRFGITAAHGEAGISGCSTDSLVRNFKALKTAHGLDGLNGGLVHYRDPEGKIHSVDHSQFREVVKSGLISSHTRVFNTLIGTLGQLRSGEFETTFSESWHARTFPLPSS